MNDITNVIIDNPEKALSFSYNQVLELLKEIKKLLTRLNEFPLIKLTQNQYGNASVYLAGDTHGDYKSSFTIGKNLIISSKQDEEEPELLIFLGDYVDQPPEDLKFGSLVNILFLLCLKYHHPKQVFLLRGNHEAIDLRSFLPYEFIKELKTHFGEKNGSIIHSKFLEIFSDFPIFIQLTNGIFAAHGGIPKGTTDLAKVRISDTEQILLTLWGDPTEANRYRGKISDIANFTKSEFQSFLDRIGSKIMIRGHDYSIMGHPMYEDKLITIFSSKKYNRFGSEGILLLKSNLGKPVDCISDFEFIKL